MSKRWAAAAIVAVGLGLPGAPVAHASGTTTETVSAVGDMVWCKPSNTGDAGGVLTMTSGAITVTTTVTTVPGGWRRVGTFTMSSPISLQDGQGNVYTFQDSGTATTFDLTSYADGRPPTGSYSTKWRIFSNGKNWGNHSSSLKLNADGTLSESLGGSCGAES